MLEKWSEPAKCPDQIACFYDYIIKMRLLIAQLLAMEPREEKTFTPRQQLQTNKWPWMYHSYIISGGTALKKTARKSKLVRWDRLQRGEDNDQVSCRSGFVIVMQSPRRASETSWLAGRNGRNGWNGRNGRNGRNGALPALHSCSLDTTSTFHADPAARMANQMNCHRVAHSNCNQMQGDAGAGTLLQIGINLLSKYKQSDYQQSI